MKIIDLDWAFFSDRKAPWDGKQGYVGSQHFMSPEHIDGKVPSQASDIFSCGIILGLLLGGQHPFYENLDETYNHSAFKGQYSPIRILQPIEGIENMALLEATINACLNAKPSNRPTADEVFRALNGY